MTPEVIAALRPPYAYAETEGAMKALSIRQPWADALMAGGVVKASRRVENRTWHTDVRGEIYIHAGKRFDQEGMEFVMARYAEIGLALARPLLSAAPSRRGVILGTARLVDCVRADAVPSDQKAWAFGPWCFLFEDAALFEQPIPYKGRSGFFDVALPCMVSER